MIQQQFHFTYPQTPIETTACYRGNAITKDYYDFLVGEINRGTIKKAVCAIYYPQFDTYDYHLISV